MLNLTLFINDKSMLITIILKIYDFLKRKTDIIDLNENDRVRIHDKTTFTLILTCLIVLQNTYSKFLITLLN